MTNEQINLRSDLISFSEAQTQFYERPHLFPTEMNKESYLHMFSMLAFSPYVIKVPFNQESYTKLTIAP